MERSVLMSRRHGAALLLPALPTVVAAASAAHGHGALPGSMLGAIVLAAIAGGVWAAVRLLGPARRAGEPAGVAALFAGYRA